MKSFGLLFSAVFLIAGIFLDFAYRRSTPKPLQVQGTIVDFDRQHSKQVYPVFEFQDVAGQRYRVVSASQQWLLRFSTGDQVPIVYSKDDPEKARIDTFWFDHRWLISALIVAITVIIARLRGRGSQSG